MMRGDLTMMGDRPWDGPDSAAEGNTVYLSKYGSEGEEGAFGVKHIWPDHVHVWIH